MIRTYSPRASEIERHWFVVDATGQRLGLLASRIAVVLEGKHKPTFATHIDSGDHVIVLNAGQDRRWRRAKQRAEDLLAPQWLSRAVCARRPSADLLTRRPEEVIRRAVKGMLPRNKLGVQQLRKLKIYAGGEHPHEAQQPEPLPKGGSAR